MLDNNRIFKVQRFAIHDGPGIRTTLFFKGCPLSCQWCHNPESQAMPESINGTDIEVAAKPVIDSIMKDLIFYDESGGGVTFSGGEPLCQPELLMFLLEYCQENGIHTCLDTCGFAPWDRLSAASSMADLVHFDIKLVSETDHAAHTGKSSELILDNLCRLARTDTSVRLRFPLIPGITDTHSNVDRIIGFILKHTPYRDIDILPYHDTAKGKYEKLGQPYALSHIRPPDENCINRVKHRFETSGFTVTIGG